MKDKFRDMKLKAEYDQLLIRLEGCKIFGETIDLNNPIDVTVGVYWLGMFDKGYEMFGEKHERLLP